MKNKGISQQQERERSSIKILLDKCNKLVNENDFKIIDGLFFHGEWEMAFSIMLECLAKMEVEIKPNMQEIINNCLDSMEAERNEYPILKQLNYSDFW